MSVCRKCYSADLLWLERSDGSGRWHRPLQLLTDLLDDEATQTLKGQKLVVVVEGRVYDVDASAVYAYHKCPADTPQEAEPMSDARVLRREPSPTVEEVGFGPGHRPDGRGPADECECDPEGSGIHYTADHSVGEVSDRPTPVQPAVVARRPVKLNFKAVRIREEESDRVRQERMLVSYGQAIDVPCPHPKCQTLAGNWCFNLTMRGCGNYRYIFRNSPHDERWAYLYDSGELGDGTQMTDWFPPQERLKTLRNWLAEYGDIFTTPAEKGTSVD